GLRPHAGAQVRGDGGAAPGPPRARRPGGGVPADRPPAGLVTRTLAGAPPGATSGPLVPQPGPRELQLVPVRQRALGDGLPVDAREVRGAEVEDVVLPLALLDARVVAGH